jgi:hypothetical protein
MYTVFDARTGIALAAVLGTDLDESRKQFHREFVGLEGRRLFFIEGAARLVRRDRKVAYAHGAVSWPSTNTVRRLANESGLWCAAEF